MKAALLFTCILAGGALQAQEINLNVHLQTRAQSYLQNPTDTIGSNMPNPALVRGNRVVALPQDGMPCIVPDVRGIAPMPNPGLVPRGTPPGRMPNAWSGKMKVRPVK